MEFSWNESRAAFEAAARWFVATAAEVGDRWEAPGLDEWNVRALVGHTSRAMLTVEAYLAKPTDTVDLESASRYYRAARSMTGGPAVTQRGIDAGQSLGSEPAAAVVEIADRVVHLVQTCTGDELLTSIAGGLRLCDYLPTRTFELTIHTCDVAAALDLPLAVPTPAAAQAMQIISELIADDPRAGTVLLALTGRTGLPLDFSVL
jgi:uncharacterized protein (TIGR03083 family)